ncbi:MAG: hypothetical protein JRK26_06190 [Deltaproteobacteria bacterium]|nr:hypothetical protein [Deltaproteobacteria bacterium]
MILRTAICFCLLIFTSGVATRVAADIHEDFTDGDFDGWSTENNSAWEAADGIFIQKSAGDSTGNRFHYFAGMNNAQIEGDFTPAVKAGFQPGGLLAMFQRTNGPGNGGKHAVFVNSQEVFSVEMKKYGDKTLKGIQLNMAHNADHDWLTRLGSPYILIDNLRAVSRALEPEEFM